MKFEKTALKDCFLLTPEVFIDHRGKFLESYHKKNFNETTGLDLEFVQDNQSVSTKGALRGLHFQSGEFAQAKLVRVIYGEVLDVVVDLRPDSPTFKESYNLILSDENQKKDDLDEEMKKEKAKETLRQIKQEMGMLYDDLEQQAEEMNVKKTVGPHPDTTTDSPSDS
jgi:hypothetical protein